MDYSTILRNSNPIDLYYYQLLDYLERETGSGRMTVSQAEQIMEQAQTAVNDIYRRSREQGVDINAGSGANSHLQGMMQALPHYNEVSNEVGANTRALGEFLTGAPGTEYGPSSAEKQARGPMVGTDAAKQFWGTAAASASSQASAPYSVGYATESADRKRMMQGLANSWLQNPDVRPVLEKAQELGIDLGKYLAQLQDYYAWDHKASIPLFYRDLVDEMHKAQKLQRRQQASWAAQIMPAEYQAFAEGFEKEWAEGIDVGDLEEGIEPEMPDLDEAFYNKIENDPQMKRSLVDYEVKMHRDYGDMWGDYKDSVLGPKGKMMTWEEYTRSTPENQVRYEDIERNRNHYRQSDYNQYAPPVRYI